MRHDVDANFLWSSSCQQFDLRRSSCHSLYNMQVSDGLRCYSVDQNNFRNSIWCIGCEWNMMNHTQIWSCFSCSLLCVWLNLPGAQAWLSLEKQVDAKDANALAPQATISGNHDGVIKWKHFPLYWPFVWGPMNSPHKGQWRRALMFSLICALNKRLNKQSWGWWFETPSRALWRHCIDAIDYIE